MRAGGAHGLGQCSSPQGAEPCLSPGFLKGPPHGFGGPGWEAAWAVSHLGFPGPAGHGP